MQIILAPTNLGLRPLWPGHIPGTWRAPQALMAQGLAQRLAAEAIHELVSPTYSRWPPRAPAYGMAMPFALSI
ncbi:TPA: hypothetical protein ACKP1J_004348 [Serratia liquefaciens]